MALDSMLWLPNMPMGPQTRVDYCPLFIERVSHRPIPEQLDRRPIRSFMEGFRPHVWKGECFGKVGKSPKFQKPSGRRWSPQVTLKTRRNIQYLIGPNVLTLWNTHVFWGSEAWFQAIRVFFSFYNWFLLSSTFYFAPLSASPLFFNSLTMSPCSQFPQEIHMGSRVFLLQIGWQLLALCPPQAFHQ